MNQFIIRLFLLNFLLVFAQDYPKDYFISPLDIPLNLSGTFGELRSNHFHSGIDFKTEYKTGLPVYAVAEGFVSRIKISTFGYGKAIYITHPNGFTSVYGHLEKASPEIEALIKKEQYKEQSFEVELFLGPKSIPLKQHDLIGFSGNTGGSGGPHLHFEIRDSKTEEIINPFHFGFDQWVSDTKKPFVNGLLVYPVSEDAVVNKSKNPVLIGFTAQKDGSLLASKVFCQGTIGLGICTYDETNNNRNDNGIYKIQLLQNGVLINTIQFDRFAFNESRTINVFIDYGRMKETKQKYQKLFQTHDTSIPVIYDKKTNGLITIKPNFSENFKIIISDFHGNQTEMFVPIKFSAEPAIDAIKIPEKSYFVNHKKEQIFSQNGFEVVIPENSFYEDCHLTFQTTDSILELHEPIIPLQKSMIISKEIADADMKLFDKMYLAQKVDNQLRYSKNYRKNQNLRVYTKDLGTYLVAIDTIAPQIKPINFNEGKWMSTANNLQINIQDLETGIDTFQGFLNNQWVLFEYDYKTDTITHEFDNNFVLEGKNNLKIVVTDNVGNSTIFETHFYRSQKP
uniref:M23 family metallopeptidase n=1 Tax=Flavobacterium sp. TaxID=239 RepID=UPI00404A6DFF